MTKRRDDTAGHRLAEAEGIADGHHEIVHQKILGISERYLGEVIGLAPEHGVVGGRIAKQRRHLRGPFRNHRDVDHRIIDRVDERRDGRHAARIRFGAHNLSGRRA